MAQAKMLSLPKMGIPQTDCNNWFGIIFTDILIRS
jgi:hypothetical protein